MTDNAVNEATKYENISLRFDPAYENIEVILIALKKFLQERGLIIYGGLAIDYALRLHDDKIYPDDLLQVDYDFLSPDSVQDAYDFADIVYKIAPNDGVRAINALHVKTMRVDIGDSHFLADVSYTPGAIFAKIPYLEYQGLRFIHPDMQRIDIHSSLAFPFDNAPMEVVFHRWKKDIKRFNLLDKYYKVGADYPQVLSNIESYLAGTITVQKDTLASALENSILSGFSAYGLYYTALGEPTGCVRGVYSAGKKHVELYGRELDLVGTMDAPESATNIVKYYPYINLVPERVEYNLDCKVTCQSVEDRLVSIQEINGVKVVSIQYLMKYFLGHYLAKRMGSDVSSPLSPEIYLAHYISCIRMVEHNSPLTKLSVKTFGETNVSLTQKIALERINADMGAPKKTVVPNNYYPHRGKRPAFSTEGNPIYTESGEVM
jgi:hypothetical protein